jgi:hypothetical protein
MLDGLRQSYADAFDLRGVRLRCPLLQEPRFRQIAGAFGLEDASFGVRNTQVVAQAGADGAGDIASNGRDIGSNRNLA